MKSFYTFLLLTSFLVFGGATIINESNTTGSGVASWYGGKFHGKLTASGDVYNMNEFTAAHKTLPFGTKLRVTNKNNGKSVIVEINDRGPFVKSRVLDLSKAAFEEIGDIDQGIMNIEYEILN